MKNEQPVLVVLTPGFPKDEEDSACLPPIQSFVKALHVEPGPLNVIVLTFDYPFFKGIYYWNGIRVDAFNGWQKGRISKLFKWIKIWRTLKKIKKENNLIGLLSLWCGECAFVADKFSKKNNVQHFCWILGQDAKKGNRYVSRILPQPNTLVAISDFIQAEFERNYEIRPQHVIPIGIDPNEFLEPNAFRDIDVLGAGSLIPLKQYDHFVEVVAALKEDFPDIKVMICGKGPEEKRLLALISKYQLEDNITLAGELPHREVLQRMSRSKLFLHTSNYEGFGVVCIEALYAGCAVVSFLQPMQQSIENWHAVQTKKEMIERLKAALSTPDVDRKPVLFMNITATAKNIMQLYNYNETMIS